MEIALGKNSYGKNAVNLTKVIRHADHHELKQISVNISFEGDFQTAHTEGDNSRILPTDTMKNSVYALAKQYFVGSIEEFGIFLAKHFFSNNSHVSIVRIEISEHLWTRMMLDGVAHEHSYISNGSQKHTTSIVHNQEGITVTTGIKDVLVLKTTDSGFENYIRDQFTSLKETNDRILSTKFQADWIYFSNSIDFVCLYEKILATLLKTFAAHKSLSVQHTLYAMGENVLKEFAEVKEISFIMPNKHHILFNLEQFGMENKNEIFIATDEPYGNITGTVRRV